MDKKTRVVAALEGKETDRPPVSFWRHFDGEAAQGEACVRAHEDFYRQTDLDFIKIMHDGLTAPFDLELHDLSDLRRIRAKGKKNPYITAYVDRAKRITDRIGNEVYTYTNVFAAFTLLRRVGDEKLRYFIHLDEQAVCNAMDAISEDLAVLCQELITQSGCLGVFTAFQGNEVSRFTREQFQRIVEPYDRKMLAAANEVSKYNILHFCAWDEIENRMSDWAKYPGAAVNWAIYIDHISLADGYDYFGQRPVMGGFDNRRGKMLYAGEKAEIQQEVYRIIAQYKQKTGSTNGLILGADCSFLPDFELERFNWVSQALQAQL